MVSEFFTGLKNPKLILKYLIREKNLHSFLGIDQNKIKKYLLEADNISKKMLLKIDTISNRGTMISKLRGPIVYVCVRALKPSIMIETGVASGSSTYYILQAMEFNGKGKLYSIDLPNIVKGAYIPDGKDVGWLVPSELKCRWELILGSSKENLPSLLLKLKRIDAFLHDSLHTHDNMMFEYNIVWPYLKDGGLLISDDVNKNTAFNDFIKKYNSIKKKVIFDGVGGIIK